MTLFVDIFQAGPQQVLQGAVEAPQRYPGVEVTLSCHPQGPVIPVIPDLKKAEKHDTRPGKQKTIEHGHRNSGFPH